MIITKMASTPQCLISNIAGDAAVAALAVPPRSTELVEASRRRMVRQGGNR